MLHSSITSRQLARVYDRLAWSYNFWSRLTEDDAHRRALEFCEIEGGERENNCILEVAVGTGVMAAKVLQRYPNGRFWGMDLSAGMLRRCHAALGRIENESNALCRADATEIPFTSNTFDLLVNCYMLDLLPEKDIPRVLQEFHRVLRPGGRLVILSMAEPGPILRPLWYGAYRLSPKIVGGCRPVPVTDFLPPEQDSDAGPWKVEHHEFISQLSFRSELLTARKKY